MASRFAKARKGLGVSIAIVFLAGYSTSGCQFAATEAARSRGAASIFRGDISIADSGTGYEDEWWNIGNVVYVRARAIHLTAPTGMITLDRHKAMQRWRVLGHAGGELGE